MKSMVVVRFAALFICIMNFLFSINTKEIRKIKKYARRANKGYFTDFGKIINIIKNEPSLKTKLKLIKWLRNVIKYPIFSRSLEVMPKQILEERVKNGFLYYLKNNILCASRKQINTLIFHYDRKYDVLFVNPDYGHSDNVQCVSKSIYLVDDFLSVYYDPEKNLKALVYRYKDKIYLYMNGKVQKTEYTNMKRIYFNDNYTKYALLFEEKRGSGIDINGKKYMIKRRKCVDFYADSNFDNWALVCQSRKYKNKVFLLYKNYKKLLFNHIKDVYLNGEGVFYVGHSYGDRRNENIPPSNLSIVINSKVFKRYRNIFYYSNISVGPYDVKGDRWLYVYQGMLIDTDNILKVRLYASTSYAVHPDKNVVYYISNTPTGRLGLFNNERLVFVFPRVEPSSLAFYNPFFLTVDRKKYTVLVYYITDKSSQNYYYITDQSSQNYKNYTTHIVLLSKYRVRKYKFAGRYLTGQYLKRDDSHYFLYFYDNVSKNTLCFELSNLRLKKGDTKNCYGYYNYKKRIFAPTYINSSTSPYEITDGKFFKRKVENLWSFSDGVIEKGILFLIGSQYFEGHYSSFVAVSLMDNLEVAFKFRYSTFYFNIHNSKILFAIDKVVYELPLKEWANKFLYKLRMLCLLQKRLCKF